MDPNPTTQTLQINKPHASMRAIIWVPRYNDFHGMLQWRGVLSQRPFLSRASCLTRGRIAQSATLASREAGAGGTCIFATKTMGPDLESINTYIYIHIYMYICKCIFHTYICMYVCIYASMCVCVYVYTHVFIHIYIYIFISIACHIHV